MKVVSAAVAALVLAAAGSAHAAIVTDVDNLVLPPAGTNFYVGNWTVMGPAVPRNTQGLFQTWTPTVQGQLATLDIFANTGGHFGSSPPADDFTFTLSIYRGDVRQAGAVQLGQLDLGSAAFRPMGLHSIDLTSLAISTSPGDLMTLEFSIDSCAPSQTCAFFVTDSFYDNFPGGTLLASSDGYLGGQEFTESDGVFSPPSTSRFGNDMDFRISVDTPTAPVPEPGVWALMLAGMFGAGAVMRRRRLATLPASR